MKVLRGFILLSGFIVITGFILSCQNNPLEPSARPEHGIKYVKATPAAVGLAKSGASTQALVTAEQGGILEMNGNYVQIPAGALEEDMVMVFRITVTEDNTLRFIIEGEDVPEGEHIYFRDDKMSTIRVKQQLLAESPALGINAGTGEQYEVQVIQGDYEIAVPHFTTYNWGILD